MISNRNNETINVCIDLSETYIDGAVEAVKQWDEVLRNWRRLSFTIGNVTDDRCQLTIQETDDYHHNDPSSIAWTDTIGGRHIYIRKNVKSKFEMQNTVLHELGHAFGAQHVPKTLMSRVQIPMTQCPDVTTVAQVAAWNHLNLNALSWCNN